MKFRREGRPHRRWPTGGASPAGLRRTVCSRWGRRALLPSRTRSCSTACSARMRSCSSTTRGAGSPAPSVHQGLPPVREQPELRSGAELPYEAAKARLVLRKWRISSLELVEKGLVTDQVVLTVGYDIENLTDPARRTAYSGPVEQDRYGRRVPKAAHGAQKLDAPSSSTRRIMEAASALFDRIVDGGLLVRRMYLVAAHIVRGRGAAGGDGAAGPVHRSCHRGRPARGGAGGAGARKSCRRRRWPSRRNSAKMPFSRA